MERLEALTSFAPRSGAKFRTEALTLYFSSINEDKLAKLGTIDLDCIYQTGLCFRVSFQCLALMFLLRCS